MYREITHCRICGNNNLARVLDLGDQYLTGIFPRAEDTRLGKGPVQLVKCHGSDPDDHCGLVQMRHSFVAAEMYGENYGYRSGLNRGMVDHLHRKVEALQRIVDLHAGDLVLDIGSNDGTTLGHYGEKGFDLIGIDPSARKFAHYYRPDIKLVVDFFSAERFRRERGNKKAKIVTSIAMFYDLEDPQTFVNDVAAVLADDGIWHLEQSYLPAMLESNSYDTACHEHIEYYALRQIEWMVQRAGMKIIEVERNAVNGGSFALTVVKSGSPLSQNRTAIDELVRLESFVGLETLKPFEDFWLRVLARRHELLVLLNNLKRDGKKLAGYGASTKGNVLLQFCGITRDIIPYIAEVNEDKFGCVTPGTWIPITSEIDAHADKPDYLLVLPWHFRAGIVKREAAFLARGGKFIFPLPNVEVVSCGSSAFH